MKLNALVLGILMCGILVLPVLAGEESDNPLQVTGAEFAGAVPGVSPAEIGLARFEAAFPRVRMARTDGSISRVYGAPFGSGSSPLATAERFRLNHADLFGVPANDLHPEMRNADGPHMHGVMFNAMTGEYKFTLVYYTQYRDGLPVYGADLRLLVRNDFDYPLVLASSTLKDIGDFRADTALTTMAFDPAEALPGFVNVLDTKTVIYAGTADKVCQPRIATVLVADNGATDDTFQRYEFVCDSRTGEILHKRSLIQFVDVSGSVTAMATPGAKADICTEEVVWTYPWARVEVVGGESGYADGDGNFTLPYAGSLSATVRSYVDGLYFSIDNWVGDEEELTMVISPGTPGVFLHNEDNDDELVRAQTNIYTSANLCRDWVLLQNPSFPGISTETGVPTVVNRTDGYCPCNAWSDGWDGSINFCQSGSESGHTCPNTAWQSVLNHEYGHHIIDFTSSGQDEYGEGISDCIAMLPVDDPNLGYGFFGDCDSGLRTADNDCQYLPGGDCSTCGWEEHDCGQLLSGVVWSIRNELILTEPDDYLSILSSIVVNSILLHTGTSIDHQIAIDFLTLDDNDGSLINGTPHCHEICAGFTAHSIDCINCPDTTLWIDLPDGVPTLLEPGVPTSFGVEIEDGDENYVPGTGMLYHRMAGGPWIAEPLVHQSGDLYIATLPAPMCSDFPRFFIRAETDQGSIVTLPDSSPSQAFSAEVGTLVVALEDDFETDQGWTVVNGPGLEDGAWQRGIPAGGGDRGDPASDSDGSGRCYVTDNVDGNSDVDGGSTYLISPVMDLAGVDADVSFDLWYTNDEGDDPDNDYFNIWISNNGGASWELVEAVGPQTPGREWITHTFTVSDFVTPTSQVQLRFEASDPAPGAIVEAGIDAVLVAEYGCEDACLADGDMDDSGGCNGADIQLFVEGLVSGTLPASVSCHGDFNSSLDLDMGDVDGMVDALLGL